MPTTSAEFLLLRSSGNMDSTTIRIGADCDPRSLRLADFSYRVEVFVFFLVNQGIISEALTEDRSLRLWSKAGWRCWVLNRLNLGWADCVGFRRGGWRGENVA